MIEEIIQLSLNKLAVSHTQKFMNIKTGSNQLSDFDPVFFDSL